MPDYPAMYKRLFQSQTKAIEILQQAQQATEEIYIQASDPAIHLHQLKTPQTEKDPENEEPQSED